MNKKQEEDVCRRKYGRNNYTAEQLRAEFSEVSLRLKEGDFSDEEDKKKV